MIVFQHGRADWVDPRYPVNGPVFNWDTLEWVVLHYTAAANLVDGDLGEFSYQIPPYLRAIHRDYLNRQPVGYSIGYNAAVDWLGGTWELRGDTFKAAANANASKPGDENAKTFAILMLVDGQDGATPLAAAAVRGLVAQIRAVKPNVIILGHRDIDATQCPGTGVYAQINAGVFEPVIDEPEPPPPPDPEPPTPPQAPIEEDIMIPVVAKAVNGGPHFACLGHRTGALRMGATPQHDVTTAYVFGRGSGKAFDLGSQKVVSWAIDNPGTWGGAVGTLTEAEIVAAMSAKV